MFFLINEIAIPRYSGNNTPCTEHASHIINKLEKVCKKLFKLFIENSSKEKP